MCVIRYSNKPLTLTGGAAQSIEKYAIRFPLKPVGAVRELVCAGNTELVGPAMNE